MSARDLMAAIAPSALAALVGPIRFRSNLNVDRPISIDPFTSRRATSPRSTLLSLLKPEIEVDLASGPVVFAPYGVPTADYAPLLVAGTGLLVVTILGIGGTIGRFARPRTIAILGLGSLLALGHVASATKREEVAR